MDHNNYPVGKRSKLLKIQERENMIKFDFIDEPKHLEMTPEQCKRYVYLDKKFIKEEITCR